MTYLGDYHAGCTIFDIFTTVDLSGRPSPWTGTPSPCLVVYRTDPGGSSCTTAGITVARNCNGMTGVNAWSVNTEIDKAFYACGRNYQVLTSNGCVDSICVSNYVIGRFSLAATAALRPAVPGRCLAMTAVGQAEINPCSAVFSVVKMIERPITDPCSTIFSVVKMIERPIVDSCSTIFSVQRVVDPDTILDKAIAQPTAVFTWPATLRGIIGWLGAVASNKIIQAGGQQGVCTRDGTTLISRAQTTDDGTSATRDAFL